MSGDSSLPVEEHLHPDADAEERSAVGGRVPASTAFEAAASRSARMHAPKLPTPGSTTASRRPDLVTDRP